ncbi:MAG: F0F1 ATP synthase subunit A [Deltaproteobacteria bacterium]|nr:F0F1 ATP synthase subunit A [Deltaproteobacteria bacterium]
MSGKVKGIVIALGVAGLIGVSFAIPDVRGHLPEHTPAGEHWSLLVQYFPGLVHNLHGIIAPYKTWVAGEEPSRVSHMVMAVIVALLAIGAGVFVRRRAACADGGLQPDRKLTVVSFIEILCETILSLMEGIMGEKNARRYFPLIASLAVFILFSNLLGMIPGFVPPTDSLSTTLALGTVVFFSTHFLGVREHGISYFKHFLGPIVKWYALPLMLLMLLIETVSHLVRPCSLAVRLMGNIMGDHKVLFMFLSFGMLLVPLPIVALGLLVAIVQTLVFSLLSIVYIALAIEHQEGH